MSGLFLQKQALIIQPGLRNVTIPLYVRSLSSKVTYQQIVRKHDLSQSLCMSGLFLLARLHATYVPKTGNVTIPLYVRSLSSRSNASVNAPKLYKSQSLCMSGLFLRLWERNWGEQVPEGHNPFVCQVSFFRKHIKPLCASTTLSHNPFVCQVSFFMCPPPFLAGCWTPPSQSLCMSGLFLRPRLVKKAYEIFIESQSLCMSGLFLHCGGVCKWHAKYMRHNPFVCQVSFFTQLSPPQRGRGQGRHNPFVCQVSFFRRACLIPAIRQARHNPFVCQVSFFSQGLQRLSHFCARSQSLCMSGLFLLHLAAYSNYTGRRRHNPFVCQVSFFQHGTGYSARQPLLSQSLCMSGLFLHAVLVNGQVNSLVCHNPFVCQVSFFVITENYGRTQSPMSQSLCMSGLFLRLPICWQTDSLSPSQSLCMSGLFLHQQSLESFANANESGHNPFVCQVSFFSSAPCVHCGRQHASQSLCMSGLFLHARQ